MSPGSGNGNMQTHSMSGLSFVLGSVSEALHIHEVDKQSGPVITFFRSATMCRNRWLNTSPFWQQDSSFFCCPVHWSRLFSTCQNCCFLMGTVQAASQLHFTVSTLLLHLSPLTVGLGQAEQCWSIPVAAMALHTHVVCMRVQATAYFEVPPMFPILLVEKHCSVVPPFSPFKTTVLLIFSLSVEHNL